MKTILLAAWAATITSISAADPKPNFIQILTDDQGWGDLGSFGHDFIQSRHIDRLAAEGMKFTHCYSADAVCSPSRAAILTGRMPYRNGVYRWIPANHFCHLHHSCGHAEPQGRERESAHVEARLSACKIILGRGVSGVTRHPNPK